MMTMSGHSLQPLGPWAQTWMGRPFMLVCLPGGWSGLASVRTFPDRAFLQLLGARIEKMGQNVAFVYTV